MGHIYTLPLSSIFDAVYELGMELCALRAQCTTNCAKKFCSSRNTSGQCEEIHRLLKGKMVGEHASGCHRFMVLMTDPTGSQCRAARSPTPNCVCDQYIKKYITLERMIHDLDTFLSHYNVDTSVKRFITKVRDAGRSIMAMFDNFNIDTELKRDVPMEMRSKSINDIMQSSEFKNALRTSLLPPRPVSAPSRLVTAQAAPSRHLVPPLSPSSMLGSLEHMNDTHTV